MFFSIKILEKKRRYEIHFLDIDNQQPMSIFYYGKRKTMIHVHMKDSFLFYPWSVYFMRFVMVGIKF